MANEKKVLTIKNNILEKCSDSKYAVDIVIPDGVTEIAINAFAGRCANSGCDSLLSVVVPESVKVINAGAFAYCKKLQKITLPKKLEILGSAFVRCFSLEEIIIPEGISTIEGVTFKDCEKLKKVSLPKSLKVIKRDAFERCNMLSEIIFAGSKEEWEKVEGKEYLLNSSVNVSAVKCQDGDAQDPEFIIENNVLIKFMSPAQKKAVIPDGITEIAEGAFLGFKNLEIVEMPASVKKNRSFCF